jgi:hypothetical protein
MTLKIRNVFLTALVIILIAPSACKKKDYVTKFIYFKYTNLSLDSANNPQIDIKQYFEYNYNTPLKIATSGFNDFKKAPKFDLCNFYNLSSNDTLIEILNKAFCEMVYGSSGKLKIDMINCLYMPYCPRGIFYNSSFIIVETKENKKIKLEINHDSIPSELVKLFNYINNVFKLKTLIKSKSFKVYNAVDSIQNQIFSRYPPPPPPPPPLTEALEQKVKFTAPVTIR